MELDNANPTILSLSSLPTRGQKQAVARRGPESKYDDVLFPKHAGSWDPSGNVSSWPSDPEEDDEDEDDVGEFYEEPIDQQEIYGVFASTPLLSVSAPRAPQLFNQGLVRFGNNAKRASKCFAFHAMLDSISGLLELWFRIHRFTDPEVV
jgi:hypothetical protein